MANPSDPVQIDPVSAGSMFLHYVTLCSRVDVPQPLEHLAPLPNLRQDAVVPQFELVLERLYLADAREGPLQRRVPVWDLVGEGLQDVQPVSRYLQRMVDVRRILDSLVVGLHTVVRSPLAESDYSIEVPFHFAPHFTLS